MSQNWLWPLPHLLPFILHQSSSHSAQSSLSCIILCVIRMALFFFYRGFVYLQHLSYHIKHAHGGKESKDIYVDHSKELASKVSAFRYIKCPANSLLDCTSQLH